MLPQPQPSARTHRALVKVISSLTIVTLLLAGAPPVAAQEPDGGDTVYLPVIGGSSGAAPADTHGVIGLYRTRVTVRTPAQWHDLARTGAVLLERGEDWALVLADDAQLADLARWRFQPDATQALGTLVATVTASDAGAASLAHSFDLLLAQLAAANVVLAADADAEDTARVGLRQRVAALAAEQLAWLAQAAGVDTDSDGLSDDQEVMWCTDPARADSDYDGAQDGAEVIALKRWLNNELSKAPSTGKPFQGWPPQKVNCFDDDQDAVPDMAETLELGLNANRESTDRDKFDDGQELFGQTYCTGQGGFCSYGPLPRNEDWGVIFAEMPSWVKAPGHHPLVAAFPVPEVDVVGSSLKMETVTVVTTDRTISSGIQKSYSTAKTEGASTSVANTMTWNEWQEVSHTRAAPGNASASSPQQAAQLIQLVGEGAKRIGAFCGFWDLVAPEQLTCRSVVQAGIGKARDAGEAVVDWVMDEPMDENSAQLKQDELQNKSCANMCCQTSGPTPRQSAGGFETSQCVVGKVQQADASSRIDATLSGTANQDRASAVSGLQFRVGDGIVSGIRKVFELAYPAQPFVPTVTDSKGRSWGGAQTTTTAQYEEHTVTNGEAFSTEESWGTATAVDSAHAADLWFTYKVRNTGMEYARELTNLAFNLYIGDDPNPATTYFVAADIGGAGKFVNFMPNEEHTYTTQRIPLSLEQMKAIDLGGPIRIVVEDFAYGIDELFYQDAASAGVLIALEDGTDDGDESIDTYLIPTWGSETVLNVLGRVFPHETDLNGMMTAIWTPEYRSDTPTWCQAPQRPTDQPSKVLWCKHTLSTADWWNVYTDGLGDGSEGFQDTPAVPGATALFRFNQDSDLDGFSDRSEARLGTDASDASSFPRPEVLAGVHNLQAGNRVTSTLSLLNTGLYDAYGVEAVMVAPDDSITIDNNTVGGSGRVKALKQVIVGSRVTLQSPLPAPWSQANHAVPAPGGYYTGSADRTYTFTVNCGAGGCRVGEGSWTLAWSDGKGTSGNLPFGAGYASPTFQAVGALGLTLALYSGSVQNGESFTVAATTPRDTFQYTINHTPYTPPLVIVSYNDPQGNHRFVVPSQAMSLTAPTDNLQPFAGQMLQDVGVEIVTSTPFTMGANSVQLLVNNPSDATLQNARLFLEFINISGTVVSEVPTQVTLPPGPTYTPVSFNTGSFNPAFDASQDYIVMAFLTDYQGNVLDTAGRPLSSFQADPLPKVAVDAATLTWNFGTVAQGALLKHRPALANVGHGRLYTYLTPTPGLSLAARAGVVGAADLSDYELILRTADLPVGAYDRTATLKTSDPTQPALTVRVQGTVTAAAGDTAGGLQRPLDVPVTVTGPKSQGEWVTFTHNLGPDPQSLHPVKVYPQDYSTLYGVGRYATDFAAGTASYDMFGDGRDGDLIINVAQTLVLNQVRTSAAASNLTASPVESTGFQVGDTVLFHQSQGTANAGKWELSRIASINSATNWTLASPLTYVYDNVVGRAQVVKVPQYDNVVVNTGGVLAAPEWNGVTGGILAISVNKTTIVSGTMSANGSNGNQTTGYGVIAGATGGGFRGGAGVAYSNYGAGGNGFAGEGVLGAGARQFSANGNGGGGGLNNKSGFSSGAGGGNGQVGENGAGAGGDYDGFQHAYGGTVAGTDDLTSIVMGGGGGGVSLYSTISQGFGAGASGGGIIVLMTKNITVTGSITARGGNASSGGGGAGAGGSLLLKTDSADLGADLLNAAGGAPAGWGGRGGLGRIRIEYCQHLVGFVSTPPAITQKLACYVAEQTESAPYTTGRLNLPEAVITSKTYVVQYARRLTLAVSGSQTTTLRVPAGMASTATLQALVSGLAASGVITIDVGNDGSNEWVGPVANADTITLTNLAPVFNAYWVSQGAPVSGNLDVPVKVALSQPGQVLLTNLQFTTAGSKQRTLRVNAGTVTQAALDLALGGSGQQAISIAVDVGANGSLDWTSSVSTTLPVRLTTGNLSGALSSYLAGKSGLVDVPIRIYVAPDVPVALYDASVIMQPAVDLAAGGLGVGGAVVASGADAALYREGDVVPVSAMLSNPGSKASGPVTAAFFATAEGWGDWYIGSAFVANIPAGGSAPVSISWNTTGFNGTVPVKVVVNPYGRTGETATNNNTATTQVSITPLNPPPGVDFSAAPTLGGAPLSVQFTSIVTNVVTTHAWAFGDGETSSAANPGHVYAAAGVYTVTLTVNGPGGSATKRRTSYITVTNTPTPPTAAFSGAPTSGAAPLDVTFTNQSTGTITGYAWAFGDSQTSTQTNPTHRYTTPGTYTVSLTASGPGGSDTETRTTYIQVAAPPVATFAADLTTGFAPLTVHFTDQSTGQIVSRRWEFGDQQTSTEQHPVHTYSTPGNYTVRLSVYGAGTSNSIKEMAIEVKQRDPGWLPNYLYLPALQR